MKHINFREVNKKLNSLKEMDSIYSFKYLLSDLGSAEEQHCKALMLKARQDLDGFRNTKISQGI